MRRMTSFVLAAITAIFVLAGLVKGMIGPRHDAGAGRRAAGRALLPHQCLAGDGTRAHPAVRRLWPMLLGICAGVWAGGLLTAAGGARASIGLGAVLALYGVLGLTSVEFSVPARLEPWLSPLIGVITGIVTAATGVYMIPSAPYLQAIGLKTEGLVQALGLSFTIATVALAATLVQDGALQISVAGASVAALAPALLGMALGQWVRARVRSETFRICFFAGSLLLGAHLASRGLI